MGSSSIKVIGKNVKQIRKSLGISQMNFAILTSLSKATINNIESGKNGYNIELLEKICNFTKYKIIDLYEETFKVSYELRNKLIREYKGNIQFTNILKDKPKITYAIKSELLKSNYLNNPKEINEIKSFFEKIGWDYKGTSISNTLKGMPDIIEIRKHGSKGNTNVYLKR